MKVRAILGQRLRELAQARGLSNAEVARRSDLSERRYGHYVSGVREPNLDTLIRVARTLGTSPNALLGVDASIPPSDSMRAAMIERLQGVASVLDKATLELLVIQAEAMASHTMTSLVPRKRRKRSTR